MNWSVEARAVIQRVHMSLPETVTLDDRVAAVDAAYPFGERAMHPYKMWLKARREYLCRYGYRPKSAPVESPMERMMRRADLSSPTPSSGIGGVDG